MKTYTEFHGNILISNIGKELRNIAKKEKTAFKVLTGYGSTTGYSKSRSAVLKSLASMKKEGIIKGYFPGEIKLQLLTDKSPYYDSKVNYESIVKSDFDYGNEGIIFVFVK